MNLELSLFSIMLIPFAAAGLALIHQGLGRSRSAAHAMLASLCALAVSAIVFVLFGSAWAGSVGAATHSFTLGGAHWDWLGASPFFAHGISFDGSDAAGLGRSLVLCLELFAAGLVAIIPLSAGTDRWRLAPICLSSALLGGIIFPIFAHWAWGGGWLAQLAANFGIPNFTDAGGAGTVQVVGGLAALSVAWIAGPRRGKYSEEGIPAAIPGHNIVLVLFGCMLALVGWIGLNVAGSLLFTGADPGLSVLVAVIFYFTESGDRQKQKHYQAWQVVNTAQGKGGSGGRIEALQELNLDHVPLVGVNAAGAFLQGIQLQGANLFRADLDASDLRDSNLQAADLEYANLTWANFRQANLSRAQLGNADLSNADLVNADLTGADLHEANLENADLGNVRIEKANIQGVRNAPKGFADWALRRHAVMSPPPPAR